MFSDDDDDESDEEELEEDDFGFDAVFDIADDDFAEENAMDRMIGAWKTTPPLTKDYLSASFAATIVDMSQTAISFPKFSCWNGSQHPTVCSCGDRSQPFSTLVPLDWDTS